MRALRELSRLVTRRTYSSEAQKVSDMVVASGIPPLREGRKVTIFAPGRHPMQSGSAQTVQSAAGTPNWRIAVEVEGKWVNPLMGWTSTADHIETVSRKLQFTSKDAAIAWCEKMGMRYEIAEPGVITSKRPKRFNGYGSNFDVARKGTPVGGLRSEHLEAAGNASKGKKK